MAYTTIEKSKYKGVAKVRSQFNVETWVVKGYVEGRKWEKHFTTEREAAIAYDKKRIEAGKAPVNILKPVRAFKI